MDQPRYGSAARAAQEDTFSTDLGGGVVKGGTGKTVTRVDALYGQTSVGDADDMLLRCLPELYPWDGALGMGLSTAPRKPTLPR